MNGLLDLIRPQVQSSPFLDSLGAGGNPMQSLLGGKNLGNESAVRPSQSPATVEQPRPTPEYEPTGAFGIKGTFRDILGVLADGFLVGSGNKPMYAPMRQQEKMAQAMQGYSSQDPAERMASVEAVMKINPEAGAEMLDRLRRESADAAKAQREAQKDRLDMQADELKVMEAVGGAAAGLMRGANPATYEALRERAVGLGSKYGIDIGSRLPESYDEAAVSSFVESGLSLDDWYDNRRADARNAVLEEEANNRSYNRDRNVSSQIGARNARVAQGERRTSAYVDKSQRSGSGGSKRRGSSAEQTVRSSQVPASARTGTRADGTRVARFGGKTYVIKD